MLPVAERGAGQIESLYCGRGVFSLFMSIRKKRYPGLRKRSQSSHLLYPGLT